LLPLCLAALAAVVTAYCAWVKLEYGGWLTPFTLPFVAAHFVIHVRPARAALARPPLLKMILLSHACLVVGFLFQWDFGDGPAWLIITAMSGQGPGYEDSYPPSWWPPDGWAMLTNVALFVPVVWSWVKLRKTPTPSQVS
jgi:hypothetical protein